MVYVLISLLSVNESMYFETYLIRNVVLFQLYVPLYLLFISTHCVIVVSPLPQNIDSHTCISAYRKSSGCFFP